MSTLVFLAGCGGAPAPGGIGPSGTFTTVTSSDGDATLVLPSSSPLAPGSASVAPATLSSFNPNAILGTFYSFTIGGAASAPAKFTVSIKYRPASLPIGVVTNQLAIARFDPNSPNPFAAFTVVGGSFSAPAGAVSGQVNETGVYGIIITIPFAGALNGRYTGSASGTVALTISSAGSVAATITPANSPSIETAGTASYIGQVRFTLAISSGVRMGFTGLLRRSNGAVTAAGAWNDNIGHSGTWTAS